MNRLLLLFAALLIAPSASAQWTFDSFFPDGETSNTPHIHGLGVTQEGNVWVLPYYPFTGDSVRVTPTITGDTECNETTGNCRVVALYAYEPDGDLLDFAPLSIVTLPGGEQDTLGGERNAAGTWDYNSGRGLRVGLDNKIYASFFNTLYKFDTDGTVLAVTQPAGLGGASLTAASTDNSGNVYIAKVAPGGPLVKLNTNLEFVENASGNKTLQGFNRKVLALPDGNTVIAPNYSAFVSTVFTRPDDLTPYDSTGLAFQGLTIESIAVHPTTGNIWAGSGPSANGPSTGRYDDGAGNSGSYMPQRWYEFTVDEVLNRLSPVPSDSIVYNNAPELAKPRAIAFTPDGMTAYVGVFDIGAPALQKFTFNSSPGVATGPEVDGVTLHQNVPNPFNGSTDITFDLDNPATVTVQIYDVTGREVRTLAQGPHASGSHTVTFDAAGLAGGVYVFALEVDGQRVSRRMLHMR